MDLNYLDEIKIERHPKPQKNAGAETVPAVKPLVSAGKKTRQELIESLREKSREEEKAEFVSPQDIARLKKHLAENSQKGAVVQKTETLKAVKAAETPAPAVSVKAPATPVPEEKAVKAIKQPKAVKKAQPAKKAKPIKPVKKHNAQPKAKFKKTPKIKALGSHVLIKYIVRELLLYFAVCFALFFFLFFVNEILVLAQNVLRRHVPVHSVLKLILYSLPAVVAQSVPFATLLGFLMCLGRMTTDNEILIFRASGLRYSFIAIPVVIMGLLISVFGFVMNDYFLPLGILKYNRLQKTIVQSDPAVEIEADSIKRMNGTTLVIGGVDGDNTINDLVVFDRDSSGLDRVIVTGKTDVNKSDEPGILMQFNMSGATVLELDKENEKSFDVFESKKILLNIFDSVVFQSAAVQPREMTSKDLFHTIQELKKDETVTPRRMNRYNLEFAKKFSLPFGSLFFALLAFPLALIFGKWDGQTLGFIFGLIISLMYWAATILGQMFGVRSGWNGFWVMWTPNFLLGTVGFLIYMGLRKK